MSTEKTSRLPHLSRRKFLGSCAAAALATRIRNLGAQVLTATDITRQPTLYVVPYAHLDTQWRWEFPQTISEYLLKTLRVNFDFIEKYPHYIFNWTGSNRYRLMKEYFPADYARLKQYVAKGQWYPAGSSVEEGDVNLPSAESLFRQVLCGNTYFREDFGKASAEYMLPDCFGFPASLPTILAHAGVKGFSTQKLNSNWQPSPKVGGPGSPEETPEGIPFNVGVWEGPDGQTIIAALNPGTYSGHIRRDLSRPLPSGAAHNNNDPDWVERIQLDGKVTGVYADYHYVGTGDIGGAADEDSIKLLEAMVTQGLVVLPGSEQPVRVGDGPVRVLSTAADQMFNDIKPEMTKRMPRYKGDLELINHSAGSLTSQAYHKRWNRKNELLADAAEKASVAAAWMGGRPYPRQRLNDAWTLLLAGQFHDTGAGTSTPRAYEYAWNDDVIALNQFAGVLTSATQAVASALDTQAQGIPCVVYNPLNVEREDVVEATVAFAGGAPAAVKVVGPDGKAVPAQIENGKVLFLAKAPSVGYSVYDIQAAQSAQPSSELHVTESSLENARYRVQLNADGDVSSIFDKSIKRELLSSPLRLALSTDAPTLWPAWNMDFDQEQAAPRAYVGGPAKVRIVENGPVRVALEVSRETAGSKFAQTVRLSAGDAGNRVEFFDVVDWRSTEVNLKAVFSLAASNQKATYNWEVGTVERDTASERQFEVASHHWIDLTDQGGAFGAMLLTDVKNGSDKRDDHTLRLTLVRTPGQRPGTKRSRDNHQFCQDWGRHEIVYGLVGHAGDWRQGHCDWQAYRLSSPLVAFATARHGGALGKSFSLVQVGSPQVRVLALKKAELSDEFILRLVELHGAPADRVRVKFAGPVAAAREVNAQELPLGSATLVDGALETSFKGYQPRTFALKLGAAPARAVGVVSQPAALHYDLAAASHDDTHSTGGFNRNGDALPAEMLPAALGFNGVQLRLAPGGAGKPNAIVAKGQSIALPKGDFNRVYVLAASADGDQKAVFRAGSQAAEVTVQDWGGFIGQWDTRLWKPAPNTMSVPATAPGHKKGEKVEAAIRKNWAISANHATWDLKETGTPYWEPQFPDDYIGLVPGFIKRADLAWFVSHHHTPEGLNQPYAYSYLFVYALDLPGGAATLTLPDNDKIRVLAVSVAREEPQVMPVHPLYDTLEYPGRPLEGYMKTPKNA